jgi:type II secretory pathway predicted ATPase ExeA
MVPSFNTTGPCVPGEHYMLSPGPRLVQVMQLVEERKYFTLHAGHQTGKTTCVQWLVEHYRRAGHFDCAWVDLQTAREKPDLAEAMRTILGNLDRAIRRDLPMLTPPKWSMDDDPAVALLTYLQDLSARSQRPLVLFMDEADGLVGEAMVSFLTQLRAGYLDRAKTPFPQSVALVGRRQVRDYVVSLSDRNAVAWLGTTSPFNITAESPTLTPFSPADVAALLGQHTERTGQRFLPEAVEHIYYLSQGHPWLVNALADQVVNRDVQDRAVPVTKEHVDAAKDTIILERRTHIDSLIARLHEDRIVRVIDPMLVGDETPQYEALDDDFSYVLGLGLLARRGGGYEIANPIYKEVIPRILNHARQVQINQQAAWYLKTDGGLDMEKLLRAWQEYWREHGHLAAAGFKYREAGPHLVLMAFLQRVINGGGKIDREYGLGRGALDLMLTWSGGGGVERHAIELKLRRDTRTESRGIEQLGRYLDSAGLSVGWLVLFDQRKGRSWKQRLYLKKRKRGAHTIWVVGC